MRQSNFAISFSSPHPLSFALQEQPGPMQRVLDLAVNDQGKRSCAKT